MRLNELKEMLLTRNYDRSVIDSAILRVMNIDRKDALKKVEKPATTKKLTFVLKFDPRLPPINRIVHKHFQVMYEDPYLRRVFETDGVQVAYKRNRNLRDILCKAKLPELSQSARPRRIQTGWKTCGKNCISCIHSGNKKSFRCFASNQTFDITQNISCNDANLIYVVECRKCSKQYVGKTTSAFKTRMNAHRSAIGKSGTSLARHFESAGHSSQDFFAYGIEIVVGRDPFILGARERMWIDRLDTISRGLNCNRTHK